MKKFFSTQHQVQIKSINEIKAFRVYLAGSRASIFSFGIEVTLNYATLIKLLEHCSLKLLSPRLSRKGSVMAAVLPLDYTPLRTRKRPDSNRREAAWMKNSITTQR